MSGKTVLVTGANRGLGLEFVRQYSGAGWHVHAACREPKEAHDLLHFAPEVDVHKLDVTHPQQIAALARELEDEAIDLLINNAGVIGPRGLTLGSLDYDAWLEVLEVNTLAPMRMAEAFVDNVARSEGKRVVSITSRMGSIGGSDGGGGYIYRSSKAALNAAMHTLSIDLAEREITVAVLHPGWVRTDMGGSGAVLSVEQSVTGMRRVIEALTLKTSGRFFNYDGGEIAW